MEGRKWAPAVELGRLALGCVVATAWFGGRSVATTAVCVLLSLCLAAWFVKARSTSATTAAPA